MSGAINAIANFPNLSPQEQQAILRGPGLPPPDDVDFDFENPPNGNKVGIALIVLCLSFSVPAILGRGYTRVVIQKKVHLEDYIAFFGIVAYVVVAWIYIEYLSYPGFFVHQWNVPFKEMERIIKLLSFGLTISYILAILFVKVAILLEWMRIFSPQKFKPYFYWSCQGMIVFTVLLYSSSIIVTNLACLPMEKSWKPWAEGRCINLRNFHVATAVFNIVVDLALVILPQRVIWALQMDKKRKIGISIVFSVGLLGTACAAGRAAATLFAAQDSGDSTYSATPEIMWAISEVTCTVLVLCMPALPKMFVDQGPLAELANAVRTRIMLLSSRGTRGSAYVDDVSTRSGRASSLQPIVIGRGASLKLDNHAEREDIESFSLVQIK